MQFIQNHITDVDGKKRPVDWPTVNYMVCEVQYGGKITDDYDRRLFNTYGQAWLALRVMEPGFEFFRVPPKGPGYKVPQGTDIDVFRKYIETLPLVDNPELFGLHSNADLVFRTAQTTDVLTTILDISPKDSGGGGGESREDVVLRTSPSSRASCRPTTRPRRSRRPSRRWARPSRSTSASQQEIDRRAERSSASCARRSPTSSSPSRAPSSCRPTSPRRSTRSSSRACRRCGSRSRSSRCRRWASWFGNIVGRAEQLTGWLKGGRPNGFWLTGFFNPQGFLTANRQEVCRKHNKEGWALDDVVNLTRVVNMEREEVRKGPDEGVYIYGLFLDGCRWDKPGNKLADSVPKVLFLCSKD